MIGTTNSSDVLAIAVPSCTAVMLAAAAGVGRLISSYGKKLTSRFTELQTRFGQRIDATDARVDQLEDKTDSQGERIAAAEAVLRWQGRPPSSSYERTKPRG